MLLKFVLAIVFLLAAGMFQPTLACSCIESGPPCAAWGMADGVFLGRVVSISSFSVRVDSEFGNRERYVRVRFQVESAFRGVTASTIEVTTSADSGGGCGYPFELNGRYVVYAGKGSDNVLSTSICSRTRRVENAAEDLSFFRGLETTLPFARIFGQLGFREDVPLLSKPRLGPLAGARVVIEGTDGTWEIRSDDQGRYEISGLPAGTYEVKPQVGPVSSAQFDSPSIKVKVVERGCGVANAYAQVFGRISGRLTDGEGAPVPDRVVEIMPEAMAPLETRSWALPSAVTKPDGTYEFATLPSGRYVVGVSLRSSPRPLMPDHVVYPRTYFPSAGQRSEAQVVELIAGVEQRGVNIVLPKPLKKRVVRGIVTWSDGKRVKRTSVMLSNPEYRAADNIYARADDNGAFVIDAYEGLPYEIVAVSNNDPNGKPLRVGISSSPTPIDSEQTVVILPYPATLKGRLVDVLGKPQANIEVELVFEETRVWPETRLSIRARSDSRGLFEFTGLAPRRYVLAIHASSPPLQYAQSEYPPAFYPGTRDRDQAAVIVMREGQETQLSDFVLPERLVPEIVKGIVVWPDDRAVQHGFFHVEDLDFPGWSYVADGTIAPDGRFEARLFAGRRYVIQVMTERDQEGRDLLWLLETKPAEFLVDPKSEALQLRMPVLPWHLIR